MPYVTPKKPPHFRTAETQALESTTARGTDRTHFFPRRGYLELNGLWPLIWRHTGSQPPDDFGESLAPDFVVNLMPSQILVDSVVHDSAQATVGGTRQPSQSFGQPSVKLNRGRILHTDLSSQPSLVRVRQASRLIISSHET
jgi:hypothetical protein